MAPRLTPSPLLLSRLPAFPFSSFLRFLDLKLGSEILSYLALLNKVAGLYGFLAFLFGGSEGSLAQLSMYGYSLLTLLGVAWGLRAVGEENPPSTLLYAHLYLLDHLLSTLYTLYFSVQWYVHTPHDGRRVAHSPAQQSIIDAAHTNPNAVEGEYGSLQGEETSEMEERIRVAKALGIWKDERGFATMVLVLSWFVKIYFILILYSFALHLRRGSWRALKPRGSAPSNSSYSYSHLRSTSTATAGSAGAGETIWSNGEDEGDEETAGEKAVQNGHTTGGGEKVKEDEELDEVDRFLEQNERRGSGRGR